MAVFDRQRDIESYKKSIAEKDAQTVRLQGRR